MKKIGLALLGLGTIGSGVIKVLNENGEMIKNREDLDIQVKKILVRDVHKKRNVTVDKNLLTDDPEEIFKDDSIDVIAEFMGGEMPALPYIQQALSRGKTVVTANKEVIAKHWDELELEARKSGAGLYFEASVAGGIPLIKTVRRSLQANHITKLMGIINGTTNFILTKMSEEGRNFSDVLAEAQRLGYAEPDPTADVEGYDARYKLSILSTICFRNRVTVDDIYCEGITNISPDDIEYAKELGFGIKLLAIAKKQNGKIEARVHPTFIPVSHPLYAVRDSYNGIHISGDMVGNLMFYGRGAGDLPTASALVSDIITACQNGGAHHRVKLDDEQITFEDNWEDEYYLRLVVRDKPGVLAEIAGIFGRHNVSLNSVIQKLKTKDNATIIFITHEAREAWVNAALEEMRTCPSVLSVESRIRLER
ncbi:MAG TPA: homoserine dehydrogenase [Ruminococcaceae bacterium]|jgi:homoserine dehydrogenase|nr:homoserine dehydrogenase [Oscillospiraceae bacterium]